MATCKNLASGLSLSLLNNEKTGKCFVSTQWAYKATCAPLKGMSEIACADLTKPRTYRMRQDAQSVTWWMDKNDNDLFEENTDLLFKRELVPGPSPTGCEPPSAPFIFSNIQAGLEIHASDEITQLCPGEAICPVGLLPFKTNLESVLKTEFVKV